MIILVYCMMSYTLFHCQMYVLKMKYLDTIADVREHLNKLR